MLPPPYALSAQLLALIRDTGWDTGKLAAGILSIAANSRARHRPLHHNMAANRPSCYNNSDDDDNNYE